jgi:hypothetical protein
MFVHQRGRLIKKNKKQLAQTVSPSDLPKPAMIDVPPDRIFYFDATRLHVSKLDKSGLDVHKKLKA